MSSQSTWGVVATIKAPAKDILNFAAHHLDLGAHRIHIYLDEDQPDARSALKRHPKCRVILTDGNYWKRRRRHKGRPNGHQHRQTLNATHCYARDPQVTWLLHADVDEFLLPGAKRLPDQLAALPGTALSARIRPIEALSDDPADPPPTGQIWCKGCAHHPATRCRQTAEIFPTYGRYLNGGFVSHIAGKIFVRTGQPDIVLRIHNAYISQQKDQNPPKLAECRLVHLHAHSWAHWQRLYRYRLDHGSYRAGLKPAPLQHGEALNLHAFFRALEAEGGEDALRAFYEEVCVATPALRDRLASHGHLYPVRLALEEKRARHFPDFD